MMELENYILGLNFHIGDYIKAFEHSYVYKVLDILHTYSEAKTTIVNVTLCLERTDTGEELKLPYQTYNWVIVDKDEQENIK